MPTSRGALLKIVGIVAAIGCIALWIVFLWWNPYARSYEPTPRRVAFLMMLVWAAGAVFLYRERFGRAYAVFVVTFFPVGLYLLGTPGIFLWIGVLTIVFLAATLALHWVSRRRSAADSS